MTAPRLENVARTTPFSSTADSSEAAAAGGAPALIEETRAGSAGDASDDGAGDEVEEGDELEEVVEAGAAATCDATGVGAGSRLFRFFETTPSHRRSTPRERPAARNNLFSISYLGTGSKPPR
jgi:hypothetical protein